MSNLFSFLIQLMLIWISFLFMSCGSGGAVTYRNLDKTLSHTKILGAPRNPGYRADVESEHQNLLITVWEQSQCDEIRVRNVSRVRETLQDGEVIRQEQLGAVQIEEGISGVVACEERFAINQEVSLRVADAVYRLGWPSNRGKLRVDLAKLLKQSLYGEQGTPALDATVLIDGKEVAIFSLSQLMAYEKRVDELVAQMRPILEIDEKKITSKEIARAYELYEQLQQIASDDARVTGQAARFLEIVYGRRIEEADASLKRNLDALSEAKKILKGLGPEQMVYVPGFMDLALANAQPSLAAMQWALSRIALSVRQDNLLCASGADPLLTWHRESSHQMSPVTRFALAYLNYAYADKFSGYMGSLCSRNSRW